MLLHRPVEEAEARADRIGQRVPEVLVVHALRLRRLVDRRLEREGRGGPGGPGSTSLFETQPHPDGSWCISNLQIKIPHVCPHLPCIDGLKVNATVGIHSEEEWDR